jgi:hypothetical protein
MPYYITFWPKFFVLWGLGLLGAIILVVLGISYKGKDQIIDGKRKRAANTLIWYFVRFGFIAVGNIEIYVKQADVDYREYLG